MGRTSKLIIAVCLIWPLGLNVNVFGQQMNSKQLPLTPGQEAIVPIAAFGANGDLEYLKLALDQGLDAGLTVNEIKEVLVQLYAYAGFPRSLNAINTFESVVKSRKQKGITDAEGRAPASIAFDPDKYTFGKNVQGKLTGRSANSTQAFVPVIDTFLKEHLFADIFGRNNLDYKSREIATISILATIGNADNQLRSHLGVGKNNGLTELQLRKIAAQLSASVGTVAGSSAEKLIDRLFNGGSTAGDQVAQQVLVTEPIFPKGNKISGGNFSGEAWVNTLTTVNVPTKVTSVGNVTFAPKSRTKWHKHPLGQILLVTDGLGYYQERGQAARVIRKGDVINCPPNVAHWHGASADSSMTHVTLGFDNGKGRVEWLETVTDDEYNAIKI